ncbi:MAG: KilA-N domain-containing protein [bacterium]
MKTNKIMIRKMGDFDVHQRTKDSMFNATALLKQWNKKYDVRKDVNDFLRLETTKRFVQTIINKEDMKTRESPYLSVRGKNGGTWMHPFLFIDFAMWINPEFKYDVIKFVYDKLIQFRNESGDNYKEYTSAINNWHYRKFGMQADKDVYSSFGKTIQTLVFGDVVGYDAWQLATQEQLDLRMKYQKILIHCLNSDMNNDEIIQRLTMFKEMQNIMVA